MIKELTILPGVDKSGRPENYDRITLKAGETISIVGPTGSGKTAFITDIELLAQGETSTKRRILINGKYPLEEVRYNPASKPIAMITQNTKCFADLTVQEFLQLHARARKIKAKDITGRTVELANKFTGEKIMNHDRVTVLSGGQTRSLLIADALLIGAAPVILLDEIENAGIFKQEVLDIIRSSSKIIMFVTHDPVIGLLTKKRLIMGNGSVKKILCQNEAESRAADKLIEIDRRMGIIRENLRAGYEITKDLVNVSFA